MSRTFRNIPHVYRRRWDGDDTFFLGRERNDLRLIAREFRRYRSHPLLRCNRIFSTVADQHPDWHNAVNIKLLHDSAFRNGRDSRKRKKSEAENRKFDRRVRRARASAKLYRYLDREMDFDIGVEIE